jgi:hypothetical protein
LQFLGAATTVTGSQFLLTTSRAKVLIEIPLVVAGGLRAPIVATAGTVELPDPSSSTRPSCSRDGARSARSSRRA